MGQVVDRVGALLGAFSHDEPRLGLAACAQRSGLSKSSAHRLLASLAEIGLVERDESGLWQIGELPLKLTAIRLSHRGMKVEATPALKALGDRYQAATAFSVPRGNEMVYVERTTHSSHPYGPSANLGSTALMWAGASGRAVLAHYASDERQSHIDSPEWTKLPAPVRRRILKEIAESETRGYAVDHGEFFEGVAGVAAALGHPGDPVAAMSLMVSPDRMTPRLEREMGADIRELAREITRRTTLPRGEAGHR